MSALINGCAYPVKQCFTDSDLFAGFSNFSLLFFFCQILDRILQTWLLGVSSKWRVFYQPLRDLGKCGRVERGVKEERVRSGGGGGVWWWCVVV